MTIGFVWVLMAVHSFTVLAATVIFAPICSDAEEDGGSKWRL